VRAVLQSVDREPAKELRGCIVEPLRVVDDEGRTPRKHGGEQLLDRICESL
jgi:hypothetical protein